MNKSDFLKLDISSHADLVWAEGEFVGSRDYYGYTVALYLIEGLYIEVWTFIATNKIEKVEPVQSDKDLQHYLKDIDIERLMN